MRTIGSDHPLPVPETPDSVPAASPSEANRASTEKAAARGSKGRQLAIPAPGRYPRFDEVFDVAVIAALHNHMVAVVCMTNMLSNEWHLRLLDLGMPIPTLNVVDSTAACRIEWASFFSSPQYDMVIFHGACAGLEAGILSPAYVEGMVDAVPMGMIVVA